MERGLRDRDMAAVRHVRSGLYLASLSALDLRMQLSVIEQEGGREQGESTGGWRGRASRPGEAGGACRCVPQTPSPCPPLARQPTKKGEEGERREEAATVENASEQKRSEERRKAGGTDEGAGWR